MKTEYKRDINGNYLILYEEEEPDTSSYQIRMLVGNAIPSVLNCKVQGVDGQFMVCFDITSKQSVSSLYEEKKIGYQDLQMILGGFVQVMEEMSEYLLNPGRLVIKPEYMYVDLEKRQVYFCYLPGYDQDVRQKFQELTEYILPKLDHEDSKAVMLGYGIYRQALEDSFHLEHIKKELYLEREGDNLETDTLWGEVERKTQSTKIRTEKDEIIQSEDLWTDEKEKPQHGEPEKKKINLERGVWIGCFAAAMAALAAIIASTLGYLPRISTVEALTGIIVLMAIGMIGVVTVSFAKKKHKKAEQETAFYKDNVSVKEIRNQENESDESQIPNEKQGLKESQIPNEKQEEGNIEKMSLSQKNFGETVVLSANNVTGPATLVSREPGELATIYLQQELTVIGKMQTAADAVIDLPTVSRIHAKIRNRKGEYYLTDLNSRNGTSVNGKMLKGDEEYCLQDQDEVDFAQARYIFLK